MSFQSEACCASYPYLSCQALEELDDLVGEYPLMVLESGEHLDGVPFDRNGDMSE
jgi:hypothetical protein